MRFCRRSSLALLLAVGLCVTWAAPAHAAISLIASCGVPSATPGPDCTATGVTTTGATLFVAINGTNSSTCPTDSGTNTWTNQVSATFGGFGGTYTLCYVNAPGGLGAGHTFTCGGTLCGLVVGVYSGTDTGGPLETSCSAVAGGASPIGCASAITPAANGALFFSGTGGPVSTQVSLASDSGLTAQQKVQGTGGVSYGADFADLVQGTAGALQPKWDDSAHDVGGIVLAVFKASGGGGGATPKCGSGMLLRGAGCEVHP